MIFIDSNIPMYAMGKPDPKKEMCLNLLEKIKNGETEACSSLEVLQEILHRYRSIQKLQDGLKVYDLFRAIPLLWLEVTLQDVDQARVLLEENTHLTSRDALHIAVMQRNKIARIVTYDRGFLNMPDITVALPEQI